MALHEIPTDGYPHAPTTECGCQPQRVWRRGRWAFAHVDQRPDDERPDQDDEGGQADG